MSLEKTCRICGKEDEFVLTYQLDGGRPVCGSCAEAIANAYSMAHSGRYLTWPNEPYEPRGGYQKRVIPEGLRWQIFNRDGFKCLRCGSQSFLRADHVIPESKGGETTLENLQTLCHRCNAKKGVRLERAA
jgi:hypothetical protein